MYIYSLASDTIEGIRAMNHQLPGNGTSTNDRTWNQLSTFLSKWADTEQQIVACFNSIIPPLQYVDIQQAFRFLYILIGRFRTRDVVAHVHLDPSTGDTQTSNTFEQFVDAVVEPDTDDEWRIRQ